MDNRPKHTQDFLLNRIYSDITALINTHNVPILLTYRNYKNQQEFFGSKKAERKFRQLYENSREWVLTFTEDMDDEATSHNRQSCEHKFWKLYVMIES